MDSSLSRFLTLVEFLWLAKAIVSLLATLTAPGVLLRMACLKTHLGYSSGFTSSFNAAAFAFAFSIINSHQTGKVWILKSHHPSL